MDSRYFTWLTDKIPLLRHFNMRPRTQALQPIVIIKM